MLDEPESGVDLENMKLVGDCISHMIQPTPNSEKRSALIITHTGHILQYLQATLSHIMLDGRIACCGNVSKCLGVIESCGYKECIRRLQTEDCDNNMCLKNNPEFEGTCACKDCVLPVKKLCTCGRNPGGECQCNGGCDCKCKIEKKTKTVVNTENNKVKINLFDDSMEIDESLPPSLNTDESELLKLDVKDTEFREVSFNGEYFQYNNIKVQTAPSTDDGIEVISLSEAIKKYPDFKEKYLWRNVLVEKDDITRAVYEQEQKNIYNGYVIIAHEGAKNINPVRSQLLMDSIPVQYVHNIMIAKKGSNLSISSFCKSCNGAPRDNYSGQHYGISELYLEDDSQLAFSMIHNYCLNYTIYPRSAARVGKNSVFISSYVCLDAVKKVQMCPVAILEGANSIARFSSILFAHEGGELDIGSKSILKGEGASCESITRCLTDGGIAIARGNIVSECKKTSGHIECQGLVLKKGIIRSIPEIEGGYDCELSHEAAVGKISQDKIDYLMSRGISEDDAVSIIIRGFLDVKIKGIPKSLSDEIDYIMEEATKGF